MAEFDAKAIGSIVATVLKFKAENGEVVVVANPEDADLLRSEVPGLSVFGEEGCKVGEIHFLLKDDYDRWGFFPWEEEE